MSDSVKLTCPVCGQMNRVPLARLAEGPKCGSCGEALADGRVAELDAAAHDKATRGDEMPLLVDYWAPWCGPCRMMAPQFAQAAKTLKGRALLAKVDTDANPQVAARFAIRSIPTMVQLQGGREVKRMSGALQAAQIVGWVG